MTKKFLRQASKLEEITLALKPIHQTHRSFHCAAIYHKSRLLSLGWNNTVKTHPKSKQFGYWDGFIHAELAAIIKLGELDLDGYHMIIARIDNNLQLAESRPCKFCANMLKQVNLEKVFYSTSKGWVQM